MPQGTSESTGMRRRKIKMTHLINMVIDLQYGSTGKGLIAGYLSKRVPYDTAVCAFAPNAGHTYIDVKRDLEVMTQQLPTAITSPTVKNIMIGPGALIHPQTLETEIVKYGHYLRDKRIMIHPHAAIVEDRHMEAEISGGMTKIGSTAKGVGAAAMERIFRDTKRPNIAAVLLPHYSLGDLVVTDEQYRAQMELAENVIVEGAQGFSLSMYHGQYPYTTSRDVTPWQIAADCGLPFKWANRIGVVGTLRTYPIRVNNRDGSSGPCYPDQEEISFDRIGQSVETTTVTKLPRRIFTFSQQQLDEAMWHCGQYWETRIFLNFANYMGEDQLDSLIKQIKEIRAPYRLNPPRVAWLGFGPDDKDVVTLEEYHGVRKHGWL